MWARRGDKVETTNASNGPVSETACDDPKKNCRPKTRKTQLRLRGCSFGESSFPEWLLAHEARWSHLEAKLLRRFSEVVEHDVDDGDLLYFGRVDL